MNELACQIKAPVAWLPAGLISWYDSSGLPVALVTSWVALIGGENPRIRTAWHGAQESLARNGCGGDFALNIPDERGLAKIREVMTTGQLCFSADKSLGFTCLPGTDADAPRLLECAVQIECKGGELYDVGMDIELCGDVVMVHRGEVSVASSDVPDICAIQPLNPLWGI